MIEKLNIRHQIRVGSRLFVGEIKCGADSNNMPFWRFLVPMAEQVNGQYNAFDFVWVKVLGKCFVQYGDFVEVLSINSFTSTRYRKDDGGFNIYKTLECNVKKIERSNYVNNN